MKTLNKSTWSIYSGLIILLVLIANFSSYAGSANGFNDIVSSAQKSDIYALNQAAIDFRAQDKHVVSQLLDVLKDRKSSNLSQCASAYYLGEIRNPDAAGALADAILLRLDISKLNLMGLPEVLRDIGKYPAMDALVKIGNPSIPTLIQNLAKGDDVEARELSLRALYRIDGDKEIVQLRLQKASQSESNPSKQARLQAALKELDKTSF